MICCDCAKELLHEFGWQIKDGKARLEGIDMTRQRMHCRACGVNVWVAWVDGAPSTYPGSPFMFCPRCGVQSAFVIDIEQDYWEIMAEDLAINNVHFPVQLLKMLYDEWPRNDRRFHRFYDYVEYQRKIFESTGEVDA